MTTSSSSDEPFLNLIAAVFRSALNAFPKEARRLPVELDLGLEVDNKEALLMTGEDCFDDFS